MNFPETKLNIERLEEIIDETTTRLMSLPQDSYFTSGVKRYLNRLEEDYSIEMRNSMKIRRARAIYYEWMAMKIGEGKA